MNIKDLITEKNKQICSLQIAVNYKNMAIEGAIKAIQLLTEDQSEVLKMGAFCYIASLKQALEYE
jgi:hypothetical protein